MVEIRNIAIVTLLNPFEGKMLVTKYLVFKIKLTSFSWRRVIVVICILHNFIQQSRNSRSVQVHVVLAACRKC